MSEKRRENALEADPRFQKFTELYVEYGNARRAAQEAGYPPAYAKSLSYKLVARLKLKVIPVLKRHGLDELWVAKKLKSMAEAKLVTRRWNPQTEQFVEFSDADNGIQMRAVENVIELLDMRPARKTAGEGLDGAIPVIIRTSIPRPDRPRKQ